MPLKRVPTDSNNEKQHRTIIATTVNELVKVRPPHDRTSAEIAAGVTPLDYGYPTSEFVGSVTLSRYLGWDPSGVTSSHQAFVNALELAYEQGANHVAATQIGARIIIPAGIMLLDDTVDIGSDNIEIIGGHGATIRTNGAFPAFQVEAASLQKIYGVTIRGIRFTSTVTARDSGSGAINCIDAEMLRILFCKFHLATEYGVRWENVITGYLQHCDFDSAAAESEGMGYGLLGVANNTSGNNNSHVHSNAFRRTTVAGVRLIGQELRDPPGTTRRECSGNTVWSNDFEHNYGTGLEICRNRGLDVRGNWFENNGQSGVSGHGHIMDIATDDDESLGDPVTSGLGAANTFAANVFGAHDSGHADFQHIGLAFQTNPIVEKNYFTSGNIGIASTCRGLAFRDNWASDTVPTFVGTMPSKRYVKNNNRGPAASYTTARGWGGSFADYEYRPIAIAGDADTTPSLIGDTGERADTLILANTGATNVTFFDDGYEGQEITVIATTGNTTLVNGSDNSIDLRSGANVTMTAVTTRRFKLISTGGLTNRWVELS